MTYTMVVDIDRNQETKAIAKTKDGFYRFAVVVKDEEGECFRVRGFRLAKDGSVAMPASITRGGFHYMVVKMVDRMQEKISAAVLEQVNREDIREVLNATE